MTDRERRSRLLLTTVACGLTVVMILAGCVACVPFEIVRHMLDAAAGDGDADAFTTVVHFRFRVAAAVVALLAAGACAVTVWLRHPSRLSVLDGVSKRLVADGRTDFQALWLVVRRSGFWIPTLLVVAGCVRLPSIDQPMRYDEAHTFVRYASRPLPLIFVEYDEPNNHILHTACVAIATRLAGSSPAVIRWPALLAGMFIPVAVYLLTVISYRRIVAGLAGILAAIVPVLVFYSVNARGYTITCVLLLIAVASAGRAVRRDSSIAWLSIVVSLSLAMWTIPTMLYGAVAVFGTLVIQSIRQKKRSQSLTKIAIAGVCLSVFTIVLYLPIILAYGPGHLSRMGGGAGSSPGVVAALPILFLNQVATWIGQGIPSWCGVLLSVFAAVGAFALIRDPKRRALLAAPFAISAVMMLQGVLPPERTWCFVVPFACILAVIGIDLMASRLIAAGCRDALVVGIVLLVGSSVVFYSATTQFVPLARETGYFPEGDSVVGFLAHELTDREPVISVTPASAILVYYARKRHLTDSHFMMPGQGQTEDSTAFLVIDRRTGQRPVDVLAELDLSDLFPLENANLVKSIGMADIYRFRSSSL